MNTCNERRALYGTQGGGLVEYDEINQAWVFYVAPKGQTELRVGDFMPPQWGLGGFSRYVD